jgi:hypothetical protein
MRIVLIEVGVHAKVHEEVARTLVNEANNFMLLWRVVFRRMLRG